MRDTTKEAISTFVFATVFLLLPAAGVITLLVVEGWIIPIIAVAAAVVLWTVVAVAARVAVDYIYLIGNDLPRGDELSRLTRISKLSWEVSYFSPLGLFDHQVWLFHCWQHRREMEMEVYQSE